MDSKLYLIVVLSVGFWVLLWGNMIVKTESNMGLVVVLFVWVVSVCVGKGD
jgi:hypothetical protein